MEIKDWRDYSPSIQPTNHELSQDRKRQRWQMIATTWDASEDVVPVAEGGGLFSTAIN